ncbi:Phenylalanyl-tRNA synthetase [Coelomomyces lativittatus]|nr:Phenylalanyl-tRNA synthetase [Coelomomyces lativittatus]
MHVSSWIINRSSQKSLFHFTSLVNRQLFSFTRSVLDFPNSFFHFSFKKSNPQTQSILHLSTVSPNKSLTLPSKSPELQPTSTSSLLLNKHSNSTGLNHTSWNSLLKNYPPDAWSNITPHILKKASAQLHRQPYHPIALLSQRIHHFFQTVFPKLELLLHTSSSPCLPDPSPFVHLNDLHPIVTTHQNFDQLLFPQNHPGRSNHDSYYFNQSHLLRTHTSAHQHEVFYQRHHPNFLITADCYRRFFFL